MAKNCDDDVAACSLADLLLERRVRLIEARLPTNGLELDGAKEFPIELVDYALGSSALEQGIRRGGYEYSYAPHAGALRQSLDHSATAASRIHSCELAAGDGLARAELLEQRHDLCGVALLREEQGVVRRVFVHGVDVGAFLDERANQLEALRHVRQRRDLAVSRRAARGCRRRRCAPEDAACRPGKVGICAARAAC